MFRHRDHHNTPALEWLAGTRQYYSMALPLVPFAALAAPLPPRFPLALLPRLEGAAHELWRGGVKKQDWHRLPSQSLLPAARRPLASDVILYRIL